MKVFRFMSAEEFKKMEKGETLINKTKHDGNTNSEGFCFMDKNPEDCYEFLSGIVSDEVCVIFETNKRLKKTYGIYADPYGSFFETITEDEFCTNTYNKKDFKIIKMAIPRMWGKWKWYTDICEFKKKLNEKERYKSEEKQRMKIKQVATKKAKKEGIMKLEKFLKESHKIDAIIFKTDNNESTFRNAYITDKEVVFDRIHHNTISLKINILF